MNDEITYPMRRRQVETEIKLTIHILASTGVHITRDLRHIDLIVVSKKFVFVWCVIIARALFSFW